MEPVLETAVEPGGIWWHITPFLHTCFSWKYINLWKHIYRYILPSNPKGNQGVYGGTLPSSYTCSLWKYYQTLKIHLLPSNPNPKPETVTFFTSFLKVNLITFRAKGCHWQCVEDETMSKAWLNSSPCPSLKSQISPWFVENSLKNLLLLLLLLPVIPMCNSSSKLVLRWTLNIVIIL